MSARTPHKHALLLSPLQGLRLPNDLILLLITFLAPEDVLAVRATCKRLETITRMRWPWRTVLQRTVINQGLPLPSAVDLEHAALHEIETAAIRATRFDRRWAAPRVDPTRTLVFDSTETVELFAAPVPAATRVDDTAPACVRRLVWLPGDLLATLHASRDLLLWRVPRPETDLEASPRQMCATRVFGAFAIDLLVDRAPHATSDAPPGVSRLCIASGAVDGRLHLSVYEVDPLHASLTFRRRLHVDATVNKVWALVGDKLLFSDPVMIIDINTGLLSLVVQPDPNIIQPREVIAAELVRDDQVVVVQQQNVLVLAVAAPGSGMDLVGPVLFYREWTYHTEARIIVPRPQTQAPDDDVLYPSVVVLGLGPHALSTLPLVADMDREAWRAGSWCSLLTPASAGTLVVGSSGSGRALWLETRALPVSGPGTRRGDTRPARCVLGLDVPGARRGVPRVVFESRLPPTGALSPGDVVRVHEREMYARPCGVGEVVRRKYGLVALALDDAVGRVALGNRDGKVQVLELA